MALFFESVAKDLVATLLVILIGIFTYFKWMFKHWERKGLPYVEPSFPFGNMENPFTRSLSIGLLMKKYYDDYKSRGLKHVGLFHFSAPAYLPIDPEYVKNIMQKDFSHFVDRGTYHNEKDDPLSAHLFAIGGQKWRNLRTKLTPTFTSGKMKAMFDTLVQCGNQMNEAMDKFYDSKQAVDIKEVVGCFTTDIIGSCAFGLECNSFKNPEAEFRKHGKNVFAPHSKFKAVRQIFSAAKPEIGRFLRLKHFPEVSTKFFLNVINETVSYRETNKITRNDMLQLLIDLKNGKGKDESQHDRKQLTIEEVAAQAFVFFLAGFETSSSTMTFCLYELAINQEIQQKVRNEINAVLEKYNGEVTYEALMDMKYMGQVIDETLRKYPPIPFINRQCVQNYTIPDSSVEIEKGTTVFISIFGLQRDPEYFPKPENFDPERFSDANRKNILPFTYIPFGEGPRVCIGLRFGMMQTKIGLTVLLKNYIFKLNNKTKTPLEIDPYAIFLTSRESILLDAEKVV